MKIFVLLLFTLGMRSFAAITDPATAPVPVKPILNFEDAREFASSNLDLYQNQTVMCECEVVGNLVNTKPCRYKVQENRAQAMQLKWEPMVPVKRFGQRFPEWTKGSAKCVKDGKKFTGLACAETNEKFVKMETDLYNLYPESVEVSKILANHSLGPVKTSAADLGGCKMKVDAKNFEPSNEKKGMIARTYMNFENRYPGSLGLTPQSKKLLKKWAESTPVSDSECHRWKSFAAEMGYKQMYAQYCTN